LADQQQIHDVLEFNKSLLQHKETYDCCFFVGRDRQAVGAHRAVLARASEPFFAMFYGAQKEPDVMKVVVTDIEPPVFHALLQYMYTKQADITPETVNFVLYAAKKYQLRELVKSCVQWMDDNLHHDAVCVCLQALSIHACVIRPVLNTC